MESRQKASDTGAFNRQDSFGVEPPFDKSRDRFQALEGFDRVMLAKVGVWSNLEQLISFNRLSSPCRASRITVRIEGAGPAPQPRVLRLPMWRAQPVPASWVLASGAWPIAFPVALRVLLAHPGSRGGPLCRAPAAATGGPSFWARAGTLGSGDDVAARRMRG